jgi:preprotein translocase subunit SecG
MYLFVAILHVLVCIVLILVVLLQSGKGGMGAAFGGASQTVFGARGAGSLLGKLTAICAAGFMMTSLLLAYLSTSRDASLRDRAEQQEERAKARRIEPTKRTKAKAGAMSDPDAGAAGEAEDDPASDEDAPAPGTAAPASAAPATASARPGTARPAKALEATPSRFPGPRTAAPATAAAP